MSNALAVLQKDVGIWECDLSLKEIREIYAPKANENEFKAFVGLGRATGLNPFLREIWLIKYGDAPASIFVGRDGFRKSAQANPNYDYHHVDAVYSNDEFRYILRDGEIEHRQNFKDRGSLVGAYCIAQRKGASKPIYVFVELKEYNTGKSNWASKPATMIKKVAEAQCLRMAFQELFAGSYGDGEMDREREIDITAQANAVAIQTHHKTFEGEPLSQSFTCDSEILEQYICGIESSMTKALLQEIYKEAKEATKGDKIASNKVSIATKKRLAELQKEIDDAAQPKQSNAEWQADYDKAETVA